MQGDVCDLCELEAVIKDRSDAMRITLQQMAPWAPGYDELFHRLVLVDGSLRTLRRIAPSHA